MSTTTSTSQSTSTPTSPSSQSNSDTATLYLFTFLATILILVLLSASLVLRSYILRRRYRQRFQRALTDTLFADFERSALNGADQFDPLGFRRSNRRPGPKPVLWDTWIHSVSEDTWSSFTPVAVRCTPPSPPSTLVSSPQPSTMPSVPLSSSQGRPSLFPQLRLPSPFSLSSRSSSPGQTHVPIGSSTLSCARSPPPPPPAPTSAKPSTRTESDAATLAVCVLVAMPGVSSPMHRPVHDGKGKGVDLLESPAPQQIGDADPFLPSSPRRSGARIPDFTMDEDGLPSLEFGVIEVKTGDWAWKS